MATVSIDEVWRRLKAHEGEEFTTKTGLAFSFGVDGAILRPSRTKYNISKADFQKALALVPLNGPGEISDLVRGSAYVWAALHDERIRRQDW